MAEVSLLIVGLATMLAILATARAVQRATMGSTEAEPASEMWEPDASEEMWELDAPGKIEEIEDIAERRPVAVSVPILGAIAAGPPISAEGQVEETIDMPRELVGQGEGLFMLRVRGESMIEAGIFDGDYVVVRRQVMADNGEVVAVLIEDAATVKILSRIEGEVWLKAANPRYPPINVREGEILGKVVTVIRRL